MTDYTVPLSEVKQELGEELKKGLTTEEARLRLERDGENKLIGKKQKGFFTKFLLQLKDVMVIIIIIAAVISFVIALMEPEGEFIDSIIIMGIVVFNAVLGVVQENKAEKALEALQNMSAPTAKVLRDGAVGTIPSSQLVQGDIVLLEAGDMIPADLRLLESASLKCEESALTGESVPVEKDAQAQVRKDAPLGDRFNMAYSGCSVTYGRAVALVTATGMNTEMGKIAGLLEQSTSEMTPLQKKLAQLGKYLGILALVICAVIFAVGMYQGMHLMEIFMTSVSLAVAAIPEGLTMVVTVVLAMGVQRMVKKNAIIRRLPAVETLGSASVICSDKTGTLTQNRMTVQKIWAVGSDVEQMSTSVSEAAMHVLRLGSICNDGRVEMVDGERKDIGDPTETAIVAAAMENGLLKSQLDQQYTRIAELPFDSDRKLMTTVNQVGDKIVAVVKGGFDVLLPRCVDADMEMAQAVNLEMGQQALRVLAVACRELRKEPKNPTSEDLEKDLTFVGLIGMIDPPREESRQAVEICKAAGIKTVMITGDHVVTASAIARNLGILGENDSAISGAELQNMSSEELAENIQHYAVYARVSPEDKIRIVQAWKSSGAVVSMTGDGVNDAPALKAADIGCAMGITGTDVAKGAADMVLTDDNFSTIVEAVREGRGIYDNIRKTIQFLLGSNLGEVFTVFFAMIFGWGAPLLAIHLLLVNVVTDALPALALGVEPVDREIMKRPPLPKDQNIFAGGLAIVIVLQGFMVSILTLIGYYLGQNVALSAYFAPSHEIGMTMAFLVLSLSQLTQAMNCRSKESLFKIGFFTNKTMIRGALVSILVVLIICLVPPIEAMFRIVDISMYHWIWVVCLSIAPLVITEIVKGFLSIKKRMV